MLLLCFQCGSLLIWWEWKELLVYGHLLCVVSFIITIQIELSECCVWFQSITQWCYPSFSNLVPCEMRRESKLLVNAICVCFFSLYSLPRSSSVMSVLFFFKAFPNAAAPTSPISSSCVLWKEKKSGLLRSITWMLFFIVLTIQTESSECCVWFQCITQRWCSSTPNVCFCNNQSDKNEWIVDGHDLCDYLLCLRYI